MSKRMNFWIIVILGSLTALGPFSIDMYLPAFPDIARDLQTEVARVSISLSTFFIGISVGQLIYGPLLDRFGRKKPLYWGLSLYIVTSLACLFIRSIDSLIFLRLLQALGSCAAAVASMAMVRDYFPVKETPKVFSLLILVLGTSPLIAPTVGGYVTNIFGWHSVFVILSIMAFLMALSVAYVLPHVYDPDATVILKPKPILKNYIEVFKNKEFFTYTWAESIAFCGLFAYVAGSPLVFMDIFKLDNKTFGWIFGFLSISFIGASQINTLLLRRFEPRQIAFISLAVQTVAATLFFISILSGIVTLPIFIAFLFSILGSLGFSSPNFSALALAPFSKNAGSASALLGAIQMGVGALTSLVLGLFTTESAAPMVGTICVTSIAAMILLYRGEKKIYSQK